MDPSKTLSVTLDVGTDNQDLLDDPLYVVGTDYISKETPTSHLICQGWPNKRVRGEQYDEFIDKF